MGPSEVGDFLKGYSKRQHPAWEQARMVADVVCKVMGGEGTGIVFPWEKEPESTEHREDEMERVIQLREMAKSMEGKI